MGGLGASWKPTSQLWSEVAQEAVEKRGGELPCTPRTMRFMAASKLDVGFWKDANASEQRQFPLSAAAAQVGEAFLSLGDLAPQTHGPQGWPTQPGLPFAFPTQLPVEQPLSLLNTLAADSGRERQCLHPSQPAVVASGPQPRYRANCSGPPLPVPGGSPVPGRQSPDSDRGGLADPCLVSGLLLSATWLFIHSVGMH